MVSEISKKILLRTIVVCMSLLFFLILFEIFLRLIGFPVYGFQAGLFQADTSQGYILNNNYAGKQSISDGVFKINTNSQGMRDFREYNLSRSEKHRVLILGDSYSFGNGANLNDSYVENLRSMLPGREVVNLGVPGYGINNEYISYLKKGRYYNADLIVLQFALNDWGTHQLSILNGEKIVDPQYTLTANKKGYLVEPSENNLRSIHLFFLTHSKAYSFFYTKSRLAIAPLVSRYWKSTVPQYFRDPASDEYKEAYEGYANLLTSLRASTNSTIIILIGPFKEDVVSAEKIRESYNIAYSTDTNQTKYDVIRIASALNISTLVVNAPNSDFFLKVDGHWSPQGNRVVAENLAKRIIEIGL